MEQIINNNQQILSLVNSWHQHLLSIDADALNFTRNSQNRNIKQIVGHMIDSVSNNIHRIIHLQYQESPLTFPNYATQGNNDRWISIQNYEEENWQDLVNLWKYYHLHFIHVTQQIDTSKLNNLWDAGEQHLVDLKEMTIDFLRHFKLHLKEIEDLLNH